MKDIRISKFDNSKTRPLPNEVVLGYDEWDKKWIKVQYREDSNRFFTFPYDGSVYPQLRIYKWKNFNTNES